MPLSSSRAHAAFAAYRFGHEDVELGASWRARGRADDGEDDDRDGEMKYRKKSSGFSRAVGRVSGWMNRERARWIVLTLVLVFGREHFSGNKTALRGVPGAVKVMPVMRKSVIERGTPSSVSNVDELIIVPGSAVYTASNFLTAKDESNWALGPHQLLEGEAKTFLEHMEIGVREAAKRPRALLIFSGGKTSREAGALSEASSYWQVSRAFDWFGASADVEYRSFTEEHARDSFENVLFSMCRFFELTRKFPTNITVVGLQVKRERFEKFHIKALGYPMSNFTYIGTKGLNDRELEEGEVKLRAAYARDPYGCRGDLATKRLDRDPFNEGAPYSSQLKILAPFWLHINTCSQRLYTGSLPWSPGVTLK